MSNFVATTRALMEQMSEAQDKPVDKAHFCATHVEHSTFGPGTCISEAHAEPDVNGNIAWYTVQFADGVRKMDTKDLTVTMGENHMHSKKKPMKEAEEAEQANEAMSHQAATTMKHIKPGTLRQNYGDKKDAANIKPGIKGVADRLAMLDRAKKEGRLKEDSKVQEANIKHPNQQKLDVHEPEKDELTAKDFEMLRKGKKVEKTVKDDRDEMKEGYELVDITTTYEMTEQVSIPSQPTFQHYLDAIKTLVSDDSEQIQAEIVKLAQEAYSNNEIDILIKAELQAMNEAGAIKVQTGTGMRVLGTRYGNSAETERNRTKKFVDTVKGPSKVAMDKLEKPAKAKK